MTTEYIISRPELLRKMTEQPNEILTYLEQVERLKMLRKLRARPSLQPYTPTEDIPF